MLFLEMSIMFGQWACSEARMVYPWECAGLPQGIPVWIIWFRLWMPRDTNFTSTVWQAHEQACDSFKNIAASFETCYGVPKLDCFGFLDPEGFECIGCSLTAANSNGEGRTYEKSWSSRCRTRSSSSLQVLKVTMIRCISLITTTKKSRYRLRHWMKELEPCPKPKRRRQPDSLLCPKQQAQVELRPEQTCRKLCSQREVTKTRQERHLLPSKPGRISSILDI